ncbi:MAG: hypothetical protein RI947_850 [Candidatus Parcubacteria bacterium]|jgi:hypothetical protein
MYKNDIEIYNYIGYNTKSLAYVIFVFVLLVKLT